jgi:hypothetical protein
VKYFGNNPLVLNHSSPQNIVEKEKSTPSNDTSTTTEIINSDDNDNDNDDFNDTTFTTTLQVMEKQNVVSFCLL